MITSVTMGLMLAMEPAEATIMSRPPRRQGKRLFGKMVMWHCLFVAALIVTFVLLNFHWELQRHPVEPAAGRHRRASAAHPPSVRIRKARACAFNMLVFGEVAFAINCRFIKETSIQLKTITENIWCWVSIGITVVLQVLGDGACDSGVGSCCKFGTPAHRHRDSCEVPSHRRQHGSPVGPFLAVL
jgi:magnesium-transporting ATPase (P-type)